MKDTDNATKVAACMAAVLATAWGTDSASADVTFTGTVTPNQTITHAHIYYGNNLSTAATRPLGTLPANQTTTFSHTLSGEEPHVADWTVDPAAYSGDRSMSPGYVILGLIETPGAPVPSVIVSMPNANAITSGSTWDELFNNSFMLDFSKPEYAADLAATPASYTINQSYFLAIHWLPFWSRDFTLTDYGAAATLTSFSAAGFAGTATVGIPEPSTFVVLAAPLAALALGRRRRRTGDDARG